MSCPHQPMFSCEECIRESIREHKIKNPNEISVFEKLRLAEKQIAELSYKLAITEGQRDNESGVLELVSEHRNELRVRLKALVKSSWGVVNQWDIFKEPNLKDVMAELSGAIQDAEATLED